MDECTHLENFSSPLDPELIEIVAAKYDAYQPQGRVKPLEDLWRGSNIRYISILHTKAYWLELFKMCFKPDQGNETYLSTCNG